MYVFFRFSSNIKKIIRGVFLNNYTAILIKDSTVTTPKETNKSDAISGKCFAVALLKNALKTNTLLLNGTADSIIKTTGEIPYYSYYYIHLQTFDVFKNPLNDVRKSNKFRSFNFEKRSTEDIKNTGTYFENLAIRNSSASAKKCDSIFSNFEKCIQRKNTNKFGLLLTGDTATQPINDVTKSDAFPAQCFGRAL